MQMCPLPDCHTSRVAHDDVYEVVVGLGLLIAFQQNAFSRRNEGILDVLKVSQNWKS